jgi:serine/threonine protein kinase
MEPFLPADTVIGNHRVDRLLMATNTCQIYYMEPLTGSELRALKVFSSSSGRATRDAEIEISTAILSEPSPIDPRQLLVVGFDPVDIQDYSAYFMRFCPQGDLFDFVASAPHTEAEIRRLLFPVLKSLHWLHSHGFAHRSIQPENILISDTTTAAVFLADMSYVARIPASGFSTFVGAPQYSAPELFEHQPYKEAADIWAFGATLFVALTQRAPFPDPDQDVGHYLFLADNEEYDVDALDDVRASADVKDLIASALKAVPGERVTAERLLGHQFWSGLA